MTVVAPGYTEGSTRIPLHVVGTNLDGEVVDQTAYVVGTGAGLQLAQGDYQATVEASPILEDGSLYEVPNTVIHVSVHEAGGDQAQAATGEAIATAVDKPLELEPADPAAVTDQMIADAREAAGGDDWSVDNAEFLAQKATQKRDAAVKAAESASAPGPDDQGGRGLCGGPLPQLRGHRQYGRRAWHAGG